MEKQTKKERREEIKKELEKAKSKTETQDKLLKAVVIAIILFFIVGFAWLFANAKRTDKPTVAELGTVSCSGKECDATHIDPGSPRPDYNTNPPSNGPHYPNPATCKIYDNEVVDMQAVHSLEHGAVWITYKDKNDTKLANQLKETIKETGQSKIILSPRAENDSKIALTSWGRIMKLDSFDKQKITDYIKLYRNGAATPEPMAGC